MAEIDSNYKYLTYEKMAKDVAEKALDEFLYNGKSIREWMQIITSEDCISRQYLVEKAVSWDKHFADGIRYVALTDILNAPSVTPVEKVEKWIEERTYMECPNCHDIWHYEENQTERFKFCPTCGQPKMQEVEE